MGKTAVIETTCDEVFSNPGLPALMEEYRSVWCKNQDLVGPEPDFDGYRRLEAAGVLKILGAFRDGVFIGGAFLLLSPVLHFHGKIICTVESLFVLEKHRVPVGGRVLRAVFDTAQKYGAVGVYMTAPMGGRLINDLPNMGFKETNRLFYRSLL